MDRKSEKQRAIAHENGGRKHENHEFLRRLSNDVSVVTIAANRLGNLKVCAIAHEIDRKQENVSIVHENGGKKHEKQEFLRRLPNHVSVVTVA